jgi:hypothetical protein
MGRHRTTGFVPHPRQDVQPAVGPGLQESAAMSFTVVSRLYPHSRSTALEESLMTATYTFDVFSSLDGYGGVSGGDWGGYWGKQGPELLDHRLALYYV